jgi:hypothetical protein
VQRVRSPGGRVIEVRMGGGRGRPEARVAAELVQRYDPPKSKARRRRKRAK